MRHLIVVLAALLIPTATMAEGPCKNDVQKFCKDATTPEGPPLVLALISIRLS